MHVLIAAAGSGSRMGAACNKLLLPLGGRPVLAWTLDAAFSSESIDWIGIVGQPIDKEAIMSLAKGSPTPITWINGGATRQQSVQLGLNSLPESAKYVLIHDGARCLVDPSLFGKCASFLQQGHSVIAATPVTDTIKQVDAKGFISHTPERSELWSAQTPQGFLVNDLRRAHSIAVEKGWNVTDDASLFERLGWPVRVLEAGSQNIKVTTPFDLSVAEVIITMRKED